MVRGLNKIRHVKVGSDFVEFTTNVSKQNLDLLYVSIPKFLNHVVHHEDRVHVKIRVLRKVE